MADLVDDNKSGGEHPRRTSECQNSGWGEDSPILSHKQMAPETSLSISMQEIHWANELATYRNHN